MYLQADTTRCLCGNPVWFLSPATSKSWNCRSNSSCRLNLCLSPQLCAQNPCLLIRPPTSTSSEASCSNQSMPSAEPLPHCAPDHKGFDNRRDERARSKDVCMTRRKPSPRMCESVLFFFRALKI
ncbi:hypothetical protein ATANTOWER_032381 [Ataeniobius toweri]|uniref:Uncharacterized protein n=1 Tax=Ataeniobius toweri TaxID=208326 RepID=A0ABU7BPI3_9TELE|nr:hypothetical protein [Ataeniobius toweri]